MTEENKQMEKEEKKIEEKKTVKEKVVEKTGEKKEEKKVVEKKETDKSKKEVKKIEKKIPKKDEAVALGRNLHISKKQGIYVCNFIKNKTIDGAMKDLVQVIKMKRAIPFKGEIPHRKGKGMMSGRYPVKAAGLFINLLKSLKGNVLVNGMDLDKARINFASANWAARPMRSNRREGKRTHVILKAKEILEEKKNG